MRTVAPAELSRFRDFHARAAFDAAARASSVSQAVSSTTATAAAVVADAREARALLGAAFDEHVGARVMRVCAFGVDGGNVEPPAEAEHGDVDGSDERQCAAHVNAATVTTADAAATAATVADFGTAHTECASTAADDDAENFDFAFLV